MHHHADDSPANTVTLTSLNHSPISATGCQDIMVTVAAAAAVYFNALTETCRFVTNTLNIQALAHLLQRTPASECHSIEAEQKTLLFQ
jgi:hypothetical protein